ncbi:MAG: hypothetical protein ABMA64_16235 [Myxococcota bacterium]
MGESADRVTEELRALGAVAHRYAGTEGEREMLHQVRSRLPEGARTRIEGFVAFAFPWAIHAGHAAALVAGGLVGLYRPLLAAVICTVATASLIAEGTGRFSVLRRMLPKSASYNLVWRREVDDALGSLVVTAPLDAPRYVPLRPRWLRRPLQLLVVAASVLTFLIWLRALAEPWGRPSLSMYVVSLAVLAGSMLVGAVAHRWNPSPVDDASAPAALLELVRRWQTDPPPGLDLWVVFTGCGYAYQNGMHAFLAMRGARLRQPALVVALSQPGRPPLRAVVSEGTLVPHEHRPTGPALVERLRWAGVDLPSTDTATVTDARAATQWGSRAVALRGGGGIATGADTVRAVEVAESIAWLFADDLRRVQLNPPHRQELVPEHTEEASPERLNRIHVSVPGRR